MPPASTIFEFVCLILLRKAKERTWIGFASILMLALFAIRLIVLITTRMTTKSALKIRSVVTSRVAIQRLQEMSRQY
jgi:hypothetical protein